MTTRTIHYADGDTPLEGYFASNTASGAAGVLVCHTWAGQGDFENGVADKLSKLGYAALAADVYGKGVRGSNPEENAALLQPMLDDRALLLRRLRAGIECLRAQPEVDAERIAVIGFCFGGLCALDVARSGTQVSGVVSFHGLLHAPNLEPGSVTAKVLALHGWDDPLATPEDALAFAAEMTALDADWQLHAYGGTVHAFTNPNADDGASGMLYSESATTRAFRSMQHFLSDVF
ncbi:MAG: dienelactone hydrolase family protein [Pseudomonadota bacterium]